MFLETTQRIGNDVACQSSWKKEPRERFLAHAYMCALLRVPSDCVACSAVTEAFKIIHAPTGVPQGNISESSMTLGCVGSPPAFPGRQTFVSSKGG